MHLLRSRAFLKGSAAAVSSEVTVFKKEKKAGKNSEDGGVEGIRGRRAGVVLASDVTGMSSQGRVGGSGEPNHT